MDYFLRKKVPKSRIQSILISRLYYTKLKAIEWLVNHKFQHYKIHETKNYYRFRQFDPLQNKNYRTINLKPGIDAIIEY